MIRYTSVFSAKMSVICINGNNQHCERYTTEELYEEMADLLRKFCLIRNISGRNGNPELNSEIQSLHFDISRCVDLYYLGEETMALKCLESIMDDKTLQQFAYEIGDYIYTITELKIIPCIVNDGNFVGNVCGCVHCQQEAADE